MLTLLFIDFCTLLCNDLSKKVFLFPRLFAAAKSRPPIPKEGGGGKGKSIRGNWHHFHGETAVRFVFSWYQIYCRMHIKKTFMFNHYLGDLELNAHKSLFYAHEK
ncbi:hypothetical protein CIK44_04340 [Bacillus sp. X2(2017)]|nr:hypothetical protein CIK44_04340 [Bacillus sp. X2(2017)]